MPSSIPGSARCCRPARPARLGLGPQRPATALIGLGLSLAARCRPFLLLGAFRFLQLLPLAWSNLANPTLRIPYAALPFAVLFAAAAVHRAWAAAAPWLAARLTVA